MKVAIVGIGIADVDRIDRENILSATLWAMAQAVASLSETPKLVLVDGNKAPRLTMRSRTIVKGDAKCLSIAAASIIAKVTRDRIMMELARDYPGYGFERHKGYGTPEHQAAIDKLGVSVLAPALVQAGAAGARPRDRRDWPPRHREPALQVAHRIRKYKSLACATRIQARFAIMYKDRRLAARV